MPHPYSDQVVTDGADPVWQIPFVILVLVGLLIAAYRFCIIQTVLENGQVVTRNRWQSDKLLATDAKGIFRQANASGFLTPSTRTTLSRAHNGKEIAFGLLIYCWGVCLAALATMQLGTTPITLSPAHTAICMVLGLVAMIFGALVVIRRKRNNPFADKNLRP